MDWLKLDEQKQLYPIHSGHVLTGVCTHMREYTNLPEWSGLIKNWSCIKAWVLTWCATIVHHDL